MAVVGVKHSTVVTVPDDGTSPVGSDEWNAGHVITGLENVDNTSDVNKPVSTAQSAAIAASTAAVATLTNKTFDTAGAGNVFKVNGSIVTSISSFLDILGATQGQVLYRGASGWTVLSPGTAGQLLSTGGAAGFPSWITATGTGTVTSVTVGGTTIATSGTLPAVAYDAAQSLTAVQQDQARKNIGAPPVFNVMAAPYNAKGDFSTKFDIAMAIGSTTATSASQWTAGDVGKYITIQGAGALASTTAATVTSLAASIAGTNTFSPNQCVTFSLSVGTNIAAGVPYFVSPTGLSGTAFQITTSPGSATVLVPNGSGTASVKASGDLVGTIASFTNSTTVVLSVANGSGSAISSRQTEFGTDDTAAIQSAINAAVAAGGGKVYLPAGKTFMVSRLNMTNIGVSVVLTGEGPNSSRLTPLSVASYGTATGHVIDMTGSLFVRLENFQLGAYNTLPMPTTGIFLAPVASNASNRIRLNNVYVSGKFSVAAIYNYGVPSSDAYACDFYNYAPGAGQHIASIWTSSNISALSSSFATVVTGIWGPSDWSFFDCEWHRFSGAGADNAVCIWDGTTNINLYGGVVSGGATAYHFYYGTVISMAFWGVTHETESEPVVPIYVHYKVSGTVSNVVYTPPGHYLGAGGGVFNGTPTTTPIVSTTF